LVGSPEWEQELALRSSCPTHRGRLAEDAEFRRSSLFDPVPDRLRAFLELDAAEYESVPATLVLHGAADLLAPPALARALGARLPQAELLLVAGAPHDVLNDATHRSVAGAVVQWLERLRGGAPFARIIDPVVEPVVETVIEPA
jgi:pimeloyl-ACP methyl ester carboxylesterase